ncbi:MAG: lycopene cyclase family protein [Lewinella sp.]|uniref:lycopene cyclase family protein n=1 Tax=Lewinella sp. TaxID=2004506 RepID=UPI003D6B89C5
MDNSPTSYDYDFIVAGAGAAGRSFVYHLLQSPLRDSRVLLLDREQKKTDDRTWSFWEVDNGPFEEIVHHRWPVLWFYNEDFARKMEIAPFTYKVILAADYYRYTNEAFAKAPQVEQQITNIHAIRNTNNGVVVETDAGTVTARWCINSTARPEIDKSKVSYLDQHFRGWFIKTARPVFDPGQAVMMDFRTPQEGEFRFLYVLPTSTTEALVEVAIFSNQHLPEAGYDRIIQNYLDKHWPQLPRYTVTRTESGNIPMTDYEFPLFKDHIINVGMSGGDTRASTGYTFIYIHRRIERIINGLLHKGDPRAGDDWAIRRHRFYDSVMLSVLEQQKYSGALLFQKLFQKNSPQRLLGFLNGETSVLEELRLMSTTPIPTFMKAAIKSL